MTTAFWHRFIPWNLVLISICLICFLPDRFFGTMWFGLDPSWQIALHLAYESGRNFGTEFAFTYGPLGILSTRLPFASSAKLIFSFDIFFFLTLAYALFRIFKNLKSWIAKLSVVSIFWISGQGFLAHDLSVFLFALQLYFLFDFIKSRSTPSLILAMVICPIVLFVKLNMGIAAAACLFAVLALNFFDKRSQLNVIIATTFFVIILNISCTVFNVSFIPYLQSSLAIASGFNEVMFIPADKRWVELQVAAALCGFLAISLLCFSWARKRSLIDLCMLGMVAGFLFLLFKQGFVRADEHVFTFFTWVPAVVALMAFALPDQLKRAAFIPLVVSILVGGFYNLDRFSYQYIEQRVSGFGQYLEELKTISDLPKHPRFPEESDLPKDLIAKIGTDTVDVFPWEISSVYAAGLNYDPRPVMQSYVAYGSFLDQQNADFINSDRAPRYLIYAHHCADELYCFFDESKTKLAILSNYQVAASWPYRLLLERRTASINLSSAEGRKGQVMLGDPYKVKADDGLESVKFDLEYSLLGKLRATFYQPAPLYMVFKLKSGGTKRFPVRRPIINSGVIVSHYADRIEHMNQFFTENFNLMPQVEWVKITSPMPWAFKSEIGFEATIVKFLNH